MHAPIHHAPLSPPEPPSAARRTSTPPGPRRPARSRIGRAAAIVTGFAAIGAIAATSSNPVAAIFDGDDTTVSDNPWQVALTSDGEQFCGGSLVSDRIVLTAAHCVEGATASDIVVRAGVTDLRTGDGQRRDVDSVIERPEWSESQTGDLAMLVLERPVDVGADVAPIALATLAEAEAVSTGRVTGWGVTRDGDLPSVLQGAEVPLVDDAVCRPDLQHDAERELCAGGTGTDTCSGDSGGPLTVATDRGRALAGVTSWGIECGADSPGAYAEVAAFADWIRDRIDDPDAPVPPRPGGGDDTTDGADVDDQDDGEFIELPDEFWDQRTPLEWEEMPDDEFFDLVDRWLADDGSAEDDPGADDAVVTTDPTSAFDTNGDGLVQWSELADVFG